MPDTSMQTVNELGIGHFVQAPSIAPEAVSLKLNSHAASTLYIDKSNSKFRMEFMMVIKRSHTGDKVCVDRDVAACLSLCGSTGHVMNSEPFLKKPRHQASSAPQGGRCDQMFFLGSH